ncbi:MAG: SGNH/GDSL hydrolase family protein [Firmicutes bacterium]|nr:SGNH/GDSL hydrolase family protein [Bacillota bacterium]
MTLTFDQICSITTGAAQITQEENGIVFHRFTAPQENLYKSTGQDGCTKAYSTPGVKLMFRTDSPTLTMRVAVSPGSSRTYFSFDVYVNETLADCLDNFPAEGLPIPYPKFPCPLGHFSKTIDLGPGIKNVSIAFPWSVAPVLEELSLEDEALLEPIKPARKMVAFGDSITHGYDAQRPSLRYAAQLAAALDAEEFNKGIGGEVFVPPLAKLKEDFVPDFVTVAYGTNDWAKTSLDTFKTNCRSFYSLLSQNYPSTPIFALTPIWRKDRDAVTAVGSFDSVEPLVRELTQDLPNVIVISGADLVPKDENYYADFSLHPNDEGFNHYYHNLYKKIKAELDRF